MAKLCQTITYLRERTKNSLRNYDLYTLYTLKISFRKEQIQGLSITDAQIRHIEENRIHFKFNTIHSKISQLFIASLELILLAQINQETVLVHNTLKTNRFMPPFSSVYGMLINVCMRKVRINRC